MEESTKKYLAEKKYYTFCFFLIAMIDVLRTCEISSIEISTGLVLLPRILFGLRAGDIWLMVANSTSIIILLILYKMYDFKIKKTLFNVVWSVLNLIVMFFIPILKNRYELNLHVWKYEVAIVTVWLFGVFFAEYIKVGLLYGLKKKITPTGVLWILFTLFTTVSVNEQKIWPLVFLVLFGFVYMCDLDNNHKKMILDGFLDGLLWSFLIVVLAGFMIRPYDYLRYYGIYGNCNMLALYCLIIYTALIAKHRLIEISDCKKKIIWYVMIGSNLALQIMTMCRTVWVVSFILTIFYLFWIRKVLLKNEMIKIVKLCFSIILSVVIMFIPVFLCARWTSTIFPVRVWYEGEWGNEERVAFEDPATSEKYTDLGEFMSFFLKRLGNEDAEASEDEVADEKVIQMPIKEEITLFKRIDGLLSGRLSIYKLYLQDVEWFGNLQSEGYYVIGDDFITQHTHNIFLQTIFYYGIFAGSVLFCLAAVLVINGYKNMKNNIYNPYAMISFLFTCVIFFFGTMELVWLLGQMSLFVLFFVNSMKSLEYEL